MEIDDGARIRIDSIAEIIAECKLAVHDLSRTQLDRKTRLPRFNMPLELGMFFGAKRFGASSHQDKACIILDTERYRYQKFISDIAGQDIRGHGGAVSTAITAVRNWLQAHAERVTIPGSQKIHARYLSFSRALPRLCKRVHWNARALTFNEKVHLMREWSANAPL